MALFGASFQIGRSALAAYQAAISVVGQNIANVSNPNYTRQSGRLEAQVGGPVLGGIAPGAGVRLTAIQRHMDQALESRLRLSLSDRSAAEISYQTLSQTEALYNELTQQDISTQLSEFFGTFGGVQTSPQDTGSRNLVLNAAQGLVASLQRQRSGVVQQVEDLNAQAKTAVERAGQITQEVADLNQLIVSQEADGQTIAGALRDRRDALLRELSEYMDVQVREQENGSVNVYVGSEPLVEFDRSRGPALEIVLEDGLELASVRFSDNNGTMNIRSGKIAGILDSRDQYMRGQLDRLDRLARGLIFEVNRLHATGVGLTGYQNVTGSYAVLDPAAPLNSDAAGLPFQPKNGTFIVHVRDSGSGQVITRQIEIDLDGLNGDDTSLADLAAQLSTVPGLTASVTTDNRLSIQSGTDKEFWFSEDTSDALASLGVASFFEGTSAGDIEINPAVRGDPRLIAASASGAQNDGDNAGRIARLADSEARSGLLDSMSIGDFHDSTIAKLAVDAAGTLTDYESADAVHSGLLAQREAISGVSLDEEALNLTKFERAYEGASRYLGVLNNLTDEILTLLS